VSRIVWRIAADTPTYVADDLTGTGAKLTGGRWNRAGAPVVYASASRALACLETIVHLNAGGLPLNRYLVAIEIPDDVWARARRETADGLGVGWDAEPAGMISIDLGTDWLNAMTSAVLVVPSIVIPEEFNVLLNPLHPEIKAVIATKIRRWTYDPRLVPQAGGGT
jgi:RES domain-containing protein